MIEAFGTHLDEKNYGQDEFEKGGNYNYHFKENLLNFCELTCSHTSITQVALEASLDAQ
jgi:hypothetical protein